MKGKAISIMLATVMMCTMAACGGEYGERHEREEDKALVVDGKGAEQTSAPTLSSTPAPTLAPTPTPTPVPTPAPKTEGEKLADQYNGFVETPMDLNSRTIRIACSADSRYNYVRRDGKEEISFTSAGTLYVIDILKEIEKDYNCKFEVTPSRRGRDIIQDLLDGKAAGAPCYDIIDMDVSETDLNQIYAQGLLMDLNDPAVKDIVRVDTNPWKAQSDFGIYQGKQYAINFVPKNSYDNLCNALLFNKTLADKYGLGDLYGMVKDGTWTWAKFEELCESIVRQSDGAVTPAGYGGESLIFPMAVFSNGGSIAKRVDGGLAYVADRDGKAIAAADWLYRLREKGYLAPGREKESGGSEGGAAAQSGLGFEDFKAGKCVFFFDNYRDLSKLVIYGSSQHLIDTSSWNFYGLLPHPLGPDSDGTYHSVTCSASMQAICAGVEKPEEVAAVLVAIANRVDRSLEDFYEIEMSCVLNSSNDLEMLKILCSDMRSDLSRVAASQEIDGAFKQVLKLEQSGREAFESVAEELQKIYDGTLRKDWVGK